MELATSRFRDYLLLAGKVVCFFLFLVPRAEQGALISLNTVHINVENVKPVTSLFINVLEKTIDNHAYRYIGTVFFI